MLRPDLFTATAGAEYKSHLFIEVDRATESLPTLVRRCRLYETYRRTGIEQEQAGAFPRVLWVAPRRPACRNAIIALKTVRLPNGLGVLAVALLGFAPTVSLLVLSHVGTAA
ncbi:replication-relaxation family protein [Promicromonospora sp. NPDC059942]|uniref:replication-relaxation family protein n=1 Tax=Promicromonospora sp. NPDC059942 TaxID=3347009 RepID=UPI0036660947